MSGEESEEQNVTAVVFRTDIVSAVYKFVNKSIRRHNHSVDAVAGKRDIRQASQLLRQFDLDICKGSWNGRLYHCQDPVGTFHRETRLARWIESLVQGSIGWWREGGDRPDEHESLMSFLDGDCWKFAAEGGLISVRMYYEEEFWNRLWTSMLRPHTTSYFSLVHRQFSRLVKYSRRGIVIKNLPPLLDIWVASDYVHKLSGLRG